jgi:hypothetical protein
LISTKSPQTQNDDELNSSTADDKDDDRAVYYDDDGTYEDDDPDDDEDDDDDVEDVMDDGDKTRQRRDVELHPPVVARRPHVLGRTEDGVPVLSHSYAAVKELNRTGALSSLRLYDTLARSADDSEVATTTEDPIKLHHRISPLWVPPKWKKHGKKYNKKMTL